MQTLAAIERSQLPELKEWASRQAPHPAEMTPPSKRSFWTNERSEWDRIEIEKEAFLTSNTSTSWTFRTKAISFDEQKNPVVKASEEFTQEEVLEFTQAFTKKPKALEGPTL